MKHVSKWIVFAAVATVGLVGCSNSKKSKHGSNHYAETSGAEGSERFASNENFSPNGPEGQEAQRTFRFGLDRYELSQADQEAIRQHANFLRSNPNAKLRIEGHTDERGSHEYNVALGERRSRAVMNILASEGISKDRAALVSYGKEKPEINGHDESAWAQNRRATIVYEAS